MRVDAGTSIALSAQVREDFHEPARVGGGDRLLAKVRRPRQMASSLRSTLGRRGVRSGFSLPTPPAPLVPLDEAAGVSTTSPRQTCLCGAVSPDLQARGLTSAPPKHPKDGCGRSPRCFSSTTIMNVPERRRACSNVPPRVAFPTLPTLPPLPERVDPDAWPAWIRRGICAMWAEMAALIWT